MLHHDHLRLAGIRANKALTGPRRLEIEINTQCNLRCVFCWFHAPGTNAIPNNRQLPLTLFKQLLDDARTLGVEQVYITGRGEPCLHPDLAAMLRYAKQKKFHVTLTTNLTSLTPRLLAALLLVDKIEITCCGHSPQSYARLHQPLLPRTFMCLQHNLDRLVRLAGINKRPLIKINFIITRLNLAGIAGMLQFCRKKGIPAIRLSPLSCTAHTHHLDPTPRQLNNLNKKLSRLRHTGLAIDHDWLKPDNQRIRRCYMGWFAALADVNGQIKAGCFDSPFESDGNLRRKSFKEIWMSKKTNSNRLKLKTGLEELNFCPSCITPATTKASSCPFTTDNLLIERKLQEAATP